VSAAARIAALPPPARRSLALFLLALSLLVLLVVVFLPARALITSQQQWRVDVAREIARDRGLIKSANQLRESALALKSSPLQGRLNDTHGAVAPADQLQNELRMALLASGVEPTNFKVLPSTAAAGLRVHRVEFSSIMSMDQLQAFFLALQIQAHAVRVERLRLDAPTMQRIDENARVTVLMEAHAYSAESTETALRVARAN
jgi:hypothetical protein